MPNIVCPFNLMAFSGDILAKSNPAIALYEVVDRNRAWPRGVGHLPPEPKKMTCRFLELGTANVLCHLRKISAWLKNRLRGKGEWENGASAARSRLFRRGGRCDASCRKTRRSGSYGCRRLGDTRTGMNGSLKVRLLNKIAGDYPIVSKQRRCGHRDRRHLFEQRGNKYNCYIKGLFSGTDFSINPGNLSKCQLRVSRQSGSNR